MACFRVHVFGAFDKKSEDRRKQSVTEM